MIRTITMFFLILIEAVQSHVMCSLFFTANNSEHELCFMYFVLECHDILSVYRISCLMLCVMNLGLHGAMVSLV